MQGAVGMIQAFYFAGLLIHGTGTVAVEGTPASRDFGALVHDGSFTLSSLTFCHSLIWSAANLTLLAWSKRPSRSALSA